MNTTPERLAAISKAVFKTQRKFAEALGVHETTVSFWLAGSRAPSDDQIRKLIELGINPDFLAGTGVDMFDDSDAGRKLSQSYPTITSYWVSTFLKQESRKKELLQEFNDSVESQAKERERIHQSSRDTTDRIRRASLSPEIDRLTIDQPTDADVVIPMLESSIPAGYKVPIYEDLATSFNVTTYYKNCFTMRVRGDSMIDAGIQDGDRVVIKRGHRFRNGDVIAAVVDGEITLKRGLD